MASRRVADPRLAHPRLARPRAADAHDSAADTSAETVFLRGLGDRTRMLRARRGMTRRLLATQSGVSERHIAQLEAGIGNISILLLRAIATALGVPLTALLSADGDESGLLQSLLGRLSEPQLREVKGMLLNRFGMAAGEMRRRRVALIGLRGAGKSTLGRLLADARGVPFVELDREIELDAGLTIGEIVELHGQPGYRRLEWRVLEKLLAAHPAAVIAAGGSIVAEAATFERLLASCLVVWIRTTPETHMKRVIAQGDLRPVADSRAAMDDLRAILASRESLYSRADYTVDTTDQTVERSLAQLRELTS